MLVSGLLQSLLDTMRGLILGIVTGMFAEVIYSGGPSLPPQFFTCIKFVSLRFISNLLPVEYYPILSTDLPQIGYPAEY